ncbi:heme peroxidase [Marasmius fiardii PR-910]|nr:heme peroxidase [Marasmius fiardii PR-910]
MYLIFSFLWILSCTCAASGVHWPNPQIEHLDRMLWHESDLPKLTFNCPQRGADQSTFSAQWVRLAYHDMSTHNVDDGTGGLDASIAYELQLNRPQNVGAGMLSSLNDFVPFTHPFVGLADIIAMGVVFGVSGCRGPIVPYRGGRIDATSAGPATVPEPQQDLESHIEAFRRQGFTRTEMITLVACGHTLGGVVQEDFPTIIQDNDTILALFDGTKGFDNAIVTGYLDGTTPDPLVVGPNITTNSDLRIFSSDGNATVQALASLDNFTKTCSDLLERMINTVPAGVQLTDVVEPIQYKFLTSNPNRTVTLCWTDSQHSSSSSSACPFSVTSIEANVTFSAGTPLARARQDIEGFFSYQFNATIDASTSLTKFWFIFNEGDGSEPVFIDNDGAGLILDQDVVLFDRFRTTIIGNFLNVVVAVRSMQESLVSRVSMSVYVPGTSEKDFLSKRAEVDLVNDSQRHPPIVGYIFFTGNMSSSLSWIDIEAEVGGVIFRQNTVEASDII